MSVSGEEPSISGDLCLVVARWFLRRSGSRVSILIACRRTVPLALSLCVNPMPSRITRKSTRPRVSDRTMVDTVQPHALASFRNQSALSPLMKMQLLRWNKAKPKTTRARHETRASALSEPGTGCREPLPRFRRRENNVLDIPSYRTGDYTLCAAKRDFERNREFIASYFKSGIAPVIRSTALSSAGPMASAMTVPPEVPPAGLGQKPKCAYLMRWRPVSASLMRLYLFSSSRGLSLCCRLGGGKLPAFAGRVVSTRFGHSAFAHLRKRMDDLTVVHHLGPPPAPK